jgi:hypothetical protein
MKLCIHCKWFDPSSAACANEKNINISPVTGLKYPRTDALTVRCMIDLCGPTGKWFEPLPEQEAA